MESSDEEENKTFSDSDYFFRKKISSKSGEDVSELSVITVRLPLKAVSEGSQKFRAVGRDLGVFIRESVS